MFHLSVKVFIVLLIFLGGCTELRTKEINVVAIEDKNIIENKLVIDDAIEDEIIIDDANKIFNKIGISFLYPEDSIGLLDGNKLVYKGNISIRSVDNAEWKATFFLNNDREQRFNLGLDESLKIGGNEIIITEIITYQQGFVGIEIKAT